MNKKIIRVMSFVMALMLAFGVLAFAAEDVEKTVVYTVSSAECVSGETVDLELYLKAETAVSIAAVALKYDSSKLMLTGFTFDESLNEVINATLSNCNTDESSVVVLFNEEQTYDGKLGTLHFKVRGGIEGELEIDATPSSKNQAMESIDSSFEKSVISVKAGEASAEVEEWPVKDEEKLLTSKERMEDSILLRINTNLAMAYGEMVEIDETNASVVPYIVNGRTLVPLRFVSETLGAEVVWEDGWDYCFVKKNEKEIKITFGSADIEVGGEVITYDAPIQVVENRTMVPIRFISETLGYDVYWNEANQIVAISPVDNPWVKEREAELSTINSMMVTLLLKRKL